MTTHGKYGTRIYRIWCGMKTRVSNKNHMHFDHYNALGVYPAWFNSFKKFYEAVGDPPTNNHTLDRIDTTRGYFPGNVRWATWVEQHNNRINNTWVALRGKDYTVAQLKRLALQDPEAKQLIKQREHERYLRKKERKRGKLYEI